MIKKIILATMVLMLAVSISLAAGPQGIHEPGTGLTNPDIKEAAQGTGQGLKTVNESNASTSTPGIHEPGTGITNPEMKQAPQGTGQGNQAQAAEPAKQTETPAQKTQPGFEVIFALTGFIAVAFIVFRKRN
ncbi:MAG: PGF-CTERM sorting domain-containing protein [Methanothrix sp.]|nr:PGF-CTERM sorting domain-containing protein [Methanothrix sp.]